MVRYEQLNNMIYLGCLEETFYVSHQPSTNVLGSFGPQDEGRRPCQQDRRRRRYHHQRCPSFGSAKGTVFNDNYFGFYQSFLIVIRTITPVQS